MRITISIANLDALIARFEEAASALPSLIEEAVRQGGEEVKQALSDAAPRGTGGGGPPPPGDAPGALADSFVVEDAAPPSSVGAAVQVTCTQPQKLQWVVEGRGIVKPVSKKALYWQGLPHPVMYARATQPNDFVSPVLANGIDAQAMLAPVVDELTAILEGA